LMGMLMGPEEIEICPNAAGAHPAHRPATMAKRVVRFIHIHLSLMDEHNGKQQR
jgi:hypothetical protein